MKKFLEAGEIINTHGIRGELKVRSLCDSLSELLKLKTLYLDGDPKKVISSRAHKGFALILLEGIDNNQKGEALKNKTLFLDRNDVELKEGAAFLQDILGFSVFDERTGETIGSVADILSLPKGNVLIIKGENEEFMIPCVPEFIKEIVGAQKLLRMRTIEGMLNEI